MNYSDVSVTIGGQRIETVDFAYGRDDDREEAAPTTQRSYEATCVMDIDRADIDRLLYMLTPPRRGVHDWTLAKRSRYGGRKGRSAWRRLLAKGYLGTAVVNGMVLPITPAMVRHSDGEGGT